MICVFKTNYTILDVTQLERKNTNFQFITNFKVFFILEDFLLLPLILFDVVLYESKF